MKTLKYSRQRESIKSCLMNRCDHPTADALYTTLRAVSYTHLDVYKRQVYMLYLNFHIRNKTLLLFGAIYRN